MAGPPKRFAQLIGAVFTITASILVLTGSVGGAQIVVGLLVVAAGLEGFGGVCLGCIMFGQLMKLGVIPESVCVECADLSQRYPQLADKA